MTTAGTRSGSALLAIEPGMSRAEALSALSRAFSAAGLDSPALDARVLVCEALAIRPIEIATHPDVPLGADGVGRLVDFARRRLAREPVGRILGRREFWGLPFDLAPETLEPRPDTETTVEAALSCVADRTAALRLLDLGTGSGCLVVALLHELPQAWGLGVDRSPGALEVARRNAVRNGVGGRAGFVASDWASALRGGFDLVVANPPYIPSGEIADLAPEVREHDPAAALDGGADGLAAYRTIVAEARDLLLPGAVLVVEIGIGQEDAVVRLAEAAGLYPAEVAKDLGGRSRAVVLRRS